ncbi:hypothetical protein A8O14_06115 [Polynucleobacter wuianus]|uniref:Prenyltransferase n=2 Tax=Polynucleobacter wuianus TaxID=1743168 RepID=A0A191UF78_9BURK|nr:MULTISPECIES: UbiA family prenyltransferase [Polynucleobacter]ANI99688.1 hypothetical protein A8O14_06115 [Polynucleobacter wuianus]MBU3553919.1 UbiA family prenyltransferase [Polynucleobacter sp. MWH-Post4-6-1]
MTNNKATFADYLKITRLDHGTKQVFIIPGIFFAYLLRGIHVSNPLSHILLGFLCATAIASANYVINEWFDREFDKFHPTKFKRTAVQRILTGKAIAFEWSLLVGIGLLAAYLSSKLMFIVACIFFLQGIFYNIPPLRTKDRAFVDVLSESINNPIRLMIGWAMIDPNSLPPASIIFSYWSGGAFLMAAKRYSEYREITQAFNLETLTNYRKSFKGYTEISLNVSCLVYAMLSNFFIGVFFIKYRIEYIITIPVVILLFGEYLAVSMKPNSTAQNPEKLYKEKSLFILISIFLLTLLIASLYDIDFLKDLSQQFFIKLN